MNYLVYFFDDIVIPNLPSFLQKPKMVAWLMTLVEPILNLNTDFNDLANDKLIEASVSGQVIYLEKYLNDQFDNGLRRIYIEDGVLITNENVFTKAESNQYVIYQKSEALTDPDVYQKGEREVIEANASYVVQLPYNNTSPFLLELVQTTLNKYRPAGKTYRIEFDPMGPNYIDPL